MGQPAYPVDSPASIPIDSASIVEIDSAHCLALATMLSLCLSMRFLCLSMHFICASYGFPMLTNALLYAGRLLSNALLMHFNAIQCLPLLSIAWQCAIRLLALHTLRTASPIGIQRKIFHSKTSEVLASSPATNHHSIGLPGSLQKWISHWFRIEKKFCSF